MKDEKEKKNKEKKYRGKLDYGKYIDAERANGDGKWKKEGYMWDCVGKDEDVVGNDKEGEKW